MEFSLRCDTHLNFEEVKARVDKAKIGALQKCALLVEREAKQSLSAGGKGLGTAHFGDSKVPEVYTSSAPGEPPFLRTGNLRASIASAPTSAGTYVVGPQKTAWYGRVHEWGAYITVTGKMAAYLFYAFGWRLWHKIGGTIHIPPRPFMRPALWRTAEKFPAQFKDLPLGGPVSEK